MNSKIKFFAWLWVILCILAIFLVIPIARTIQNFVSARWGRSLFGYVVLAATAAAFCTFLYALIFRLKARSPSRFLWLTAVAGLYVYYTLKLWPTPEVAIHFLEYGLLGFFLYRALSLSIRDKGVYLTVFLLGSLVGIADEIIQWMMPGRYWDFHDVGLNSIAVGLFQIAVWKGIRPRVISEKISPRSIHRASILLALIVLVLGLCASNTPRRVASYTRRLPFLAFVLKEEPMSEFTLKIRDREIGVFYSRLSPDGLKSEDSLKADHYGQVLREWKDKDYSLFLRNHHPLIHAFVYEMRVHIFRRDRKAAEAAAAKNAKVRQKALFIAFKENLILEKHFGRTLERSGYQWSAEERRKVETEVDPGRPYRSPVSAGPFQIKEKTLWAAIILFIIALACVNFFFARAKKPTGVRLTS
jgi:VanZ family protein